VAELAPFGIEPAISPRPWGFRDLRPWYDRVAEGEPIGEMWLTGDDCLISTGPHKGKRLAALFSEASEALLGDGAPSPDSPLLIKTISEVLNLSGTEIEDTPDFGDSSGTQYLLGMAKVKGKVKILLDIDRVLSTLELHNLSAVLH